MRILVISDIHANWAALRAVITEELFDHCLVIGDLVDYATEAKEVIAWVREFATGSIRGNHDHAVAQFIEPSEPKSNFKQLRNETRKHHWKQLSERDLLYLARLPVSEEIELGGISFYLTHASPRDPLNEYLPDAPRAWEPRLEGIEADIVCVGHTHLPYICELPTQTVLNPGSVGQPRDGDPRASYAIIEEGKIELKRISYNIEETLEKMEEAGLSEKALEAGRRVLSLGSTRTMPDSSQ